MTWGPVVGAALTILGFAVSLFVVYTKATAWLAIQFSQFSGTLLQHGAQISQHAARMDRYEARYVEIAEDLQRLIGRLESEDTPWPRNRRRQDRGES